MFWTPVKKFILIVVLVLMATYVSLPQSFSLFGKKITRPNLDFKIGNLSLKRDIKMHLGLDLAGGSQLTFEADMSKVSSDKQTDALTGVRNIIENRVNMFGISEPTVQTSVFDGKDRIIVELPGVSDTQSAVNLIGKTAQLIFVEIKESTKSGSASPSATLSETNLTGADLKSAEVVFDKNTGKPSISIQFTDEGGKKFAEITKRNIGKQLPIILDNQVISAPSVQEEITGGSAQIYRKFYHRRG
jgi:preprotein translocase subunit SecD